MNFSSIATGSKAEFRPEVYPFLKTTKNFPAKASEAFQKRESSQRVSILLLFSLLGELCGKSLFVAFLVFIF
jgi:hypothetical protein